MWADLDIKDHGAPPANPTYSIVVVLYKRHRYLGDALSRISLYAARPDFELILVNNSNFVAEEMPLFHCEQFRWVNVGFNYGCSGGRNLGAKVARGKFVIFIDDDGLIEDFAIEKLIETMRQNDALAVRGRVCPRSPSIPEVSHYNLGDEIVYSVPNTEGISIWRRQEFLDDGGFDTLLAGGEGLALWSRMCKSRDADVLRRVRPDLVGRLYKTREYPSWRQR